jgi:Zn-dependent peptidase ImmA (M78 family)
MPTIEQDVPILTRQEVEQRAAAILREHELESIPVDAVVLANRLGAAVHNAKFVEDNLAGAIARRGDQVTIFVNEEDTPFRKLFTLAHELGHLILHLPGDGTLVDSEANLFRQSPDDPQAITPDRRREIQANQFAIALLMPAENVRSEWKRLHSIAAMARKFNVSEAAMGIRIGQLGLD